MQHQWPWHQHAGILAPYMQHALLISPLPQCDRKQAMDAMESFSRCITRRTADDAGREVPCSCGAVVWILDDEVRRLQSRNWRRDGQVGRQPVRYFERGCTGGSYGT